MVSAPYSTAGLSRVYMDKSSYSPQLVACTGGGDSARVPPPIDQVSNNDYNPVSSPSTKNGEDGNRAYFKSAQWSPDGTSILTSTTDNILRTYILPPDLLSWTSPQPLTPYSTQPNPEPLYATAFHPSYSLQNTASTLYGISLRALPIRLYSLYSPSVLASYPLVSPTTEEYIAPHSLLFSSYTQHTFFAGSLNLISVFDINRNGEGPVERMRTIPSKRTTVVGGAGGIKGIVSALGMSSEGILAAGTFNRWVGLYDGHGRGASVGVFELGEDSSSERMEYGGTGITQMLWGGDGRYLCIAERCSDGISVWDTRGTGKRLAWLKGRNAKTNQRLGIEVVGREIWAGGVDGMVRLWEGLGMKEGVVEPSWDFNAHDDAISSTTWHFSGSVLATCSGQRHFDDYEDNIDDVGASLPPREPDNSLKVWAF